MSLSLPEATIAVLREAHEKIDERGDLEWAHLVLNDAVIAAHEIAMASAGQRIVTIEEIATILGLDYRTVRARIRKADPPIEPVKTVMHVRLYTLEDIPRIAAAHADEVLSTNHNVFYATAELRKAVKAVSHKSIAAKVNRQTNVKYADFGVKRRNRVPERVTIELHQDMAAELREAIQQDGFWQDLSHLARAMCYVWLKSWKEKSNA